MASEPTETPNLTELRSLEKALKAKIAGIAATENIKQKLAARLAEDIQLVKEASIDQLDDFNDKSLLGDSKGLAERQEKTRKEFEKLLTDHSATEKDDILQNLESIHRVRRLLLTNHLNDLRNNAMEAAFARFNTFKTVSADLPPQLKIKLR